MKHANWRVGLAVAAGLALGCIAETRAASEVVGGVTWSYFLYEETAIVTRANPAEGELSIPSSLGNCPVTSIGFRAFSNCRGLTSVTIPDSVTSIESEAFSGCSGLTAVCIHDLTAWCGISFEDSSSNPLYYAGHLYLNGKEVVNLVIPDGVTSIGERAFYGCRGLTSVTIPDSVTIIRGYAFEGCSGLTSLTIPDSVTSIGRYAFYDCSGLYETNTIPGIPLVDGWAVGCTDSLSGALDLTGIRGIAGFAFAGCRGLTSVTIPDSVTSIGDGAFVECSGLTSVTIPDSVTSIWNSAFNGCSGLTSVTIGKGVTSIGWWAFYDCSGLTSVTIPDSVTSIGEEAFSHCRGLKELRVPKAWEGTSMLDGVWGDYGKPSGCKIIYYEPEVPAVTTTGVPHVWLEENAGEALAAAGGDYEVAAKAEAANGMRVWECYLAGLSATNAAAAFKVKSIAFVDGEPVVKWEPDLNEGETKEERVYTVEGKLAMTNEWGKVDGESRFFRVKVGMPGAAARGGAASEK